MADTSAYKLSVEIGAIDKLSPVLKHVSSLMSTSQKTIDGTVKSVKNLGNSSNDMNRFNKSMKDLGSNTEAVKALNGHLKDLKSAVVDLGMIETSKKALVGLFDLAKKAGEIQMRNIEIGGIFGLDATSQQLKDINKQAEELSNKTLFSKSDILAINAELGHAQVSLQNLSKVVPQATYLAEIETGIGKSSSATSSAYNFARMAEDAGITSDPARMAKFADEIYRVLNVTHASTESLGETFKYAMPTAKMLGWNENDMVSAAAYAAVNGMENSMAGTHIKNFLERSNPLKPEMANNQKILSALTTAGLIDGVSTSVNKSGKIEITGFKGSALMQDKDHMKSFMDMVTVLEQKHDEFLLKNSNKTAITSTLTKDELKALKEHTKELTGTELSGGELEWAALMNRIYGEQGQDFAIISTHKKNVEKLNQSLERQSSLETQATTTREAFMGQLHILTSNLENLGISVGNKVLPQINGWIKELGPMVAKAKDWAESHAELAKKIINIGEGVAAFTLALAGANLAFKTLGTFVEPVTGMFKTLVKYASIPKATATASSSVMEMQANVVNLYGSEINGLGGIAGGVGGAGRTVAGEVAGEVVGGLPTRAARQAAERTASSGVLKKTGQTIAKSIGAGFKSAKVGLPVAIAMGAYDIFTAPEGKKVETGVKTAGNVMGGWAGMAMGAEAGATVGTLLGGPVGTAIGGVIGGVIGGAAGTVIGQKITSSIYSALANAPKPNGGQVDDIVDSRVSRSVDRQYHSDAADAGQQAMSMWNKLGAGGDINISVNPHPNQNAFEVAQEVKKQLFHITRNFTLGNGTQVNVGSF